MNKNLFSRVDIDENNTNIPDGCAESIEKECERYESLYRNTGNAKIALLGIGVNGHIAFNEPGTSFNSVTHVVKIDESTVKANSRFFKNEDEVPKYAVTMGISTILSAEKIIIMATGESKKSIIKKLLDASKCDEALPVTALLSHPDVELYIDRNAC